MGVAASGAVELIVACVVMEKACDGEGGARELQRRVRARQRVAAE